MELHDFGDVGQGGIVPAEPGLREDDAQDVVVVGLPELGGVQGGIAQDGGFGGHGEAGGEGEREDAGDEGAVEDYDGVGEGGE